MMKKYAVLIGCFLSLASACSSDDMETNLSDPTAQIHINTEQTVEADVNSSSPVQSADSGDSDADVALSTTDQTANDQDGTSQTGVERFIIFSTERVRSNGLSPVLSHTATFWQVQDDLHTVASLAADPSELPDQCNVNGLSTQNSTPDNLFNSPEGLRAVSAGETVQLTSNEGTWATLLKSESEAISSSGSNASIHEGGIIYAAKAPEAQLPSSLQLDAPGDEYPATSLALMSFNQDFELADREELAAQLSVGRLVWTPLPDAELMNSQVNIIIIETDLSDSDNPIVQSAFCRLTDDGEFIVPDSVSNLLTNGLTTQVLSVSRSALKANKIGDEGLYQLVLDLSSWAEIQ